MSAAPPPPADPAPRTALVVVGMHRSGTSAAARALSLMGASLPRDVMVPGLGNPLGHWEPQLLVDLNDEMLAAFGARWDRTRPLPEDGGVDVLLDRFGDRAGALIREQYGDAGTILVKDPRVSLLVPFWNRVLTGEGYAVRWLVMLRDPEEVAASLGVRNAIGFDQACRLWTRYTASAERGTAGLTRVACRYDDLIGHPAAAIARIAGGMGFAASSEGRQAATAWLDARHRNHGIAPARRRIAPAAVARLAETIAALAHDEPVKPGWVADALDWLRRTPSAEDEAA